MLLDDLRSVAARQQKKPLTKRYHFGLEGTCEAYAALGAGTPAHAYSPLSRYCLRALTHSNRTRM